MSASISCAILVLKASRLSWLSLSRALIRTRSYWLILFCSYNSELMVFLRLLFYSNSRFISALLQSNRFFRWLISPFSSPMCTSFRFRMFLISSSLICFSLAFSLAIALAYVTYAVAISASSSYFSLFRCSISALCMFSLFAIFFDKELISWFLSYNSFLILFSANC